MESRLLSDFLLFLFYPWRLSATLFSLLLALFFLLSSFKLIFFIPYVLTPPYHGFPHFIQDGLMISQCLCDHVLLHQIFLICICTVFSLWIWSDKMVFKFYITFHKQVLNFSVNPDRQKSHSYLNIQCECIILLIILHLSILY